MSGKSMDKFDPTEWYCDKPKSGVEAEELLSAARLALLCDYPFFGKIALNFGFIESKTVPTTAVDQRGNFFYCRKWVNHFDKVDAIWSMAHETMHLMQRFFSRKPEGANHFLWNLAADYVLETQLLESGLPQSKNSKLMLTPEVQEMVKQCGTLPAVYKHLLQKLENQTDCEACKELIKQLKSQGNKYNNSRQKENEKINKENSGGGGSKEEDKENSENDNNDCNGEGCKSNAEGDGSCGCGNGRQKLEHTCGINGPPCCSGILCDSDDLDPTEEQEWIEKIVAAKMHAESKGNMPAGLSDYIDQLTKSKVRWQDYLKASATRLFGRDRYTYKRINRRGPAINLRLPGHVPDGKVAVGAIDTSASMSVEEVKQCLSEFSAIMKACGCEKLWLILHDMRVYFSGWVSEADLTKLKMARGGTSHVGVFACLNKQHKNQKFNLPNEEKVTLAVLFTDLGTDFPNEKPDFEVIWGVPSDGCPGMDADVPFGKKVKVEME